MIGCYRSLTVIDHFLQLPCRHCGQSNFGGFQSNKRLGNVAMHHVREPQYEAHESAAYSHNPGIYHDHQLLVKSSHGEGSEYPSTPPHDSLSHLVPIPENPTSSPWSCEGGLVSVSSASSRDAPINEQVVFQQAPPSTDPKISRGRISILAPCEGPAESDRFEECIPTKQVCYGAVCCHLPGCELSFTLSYLKADMQH